MPTNDVDRRNFLKTSATVAASVSASAASASVTGSSEAAEWKERIGRQFQAGSATLVLQSVETVDYSADVRRPSHLRSNSIALLFVLHTGRVHESELMELSYSDKKLDLLLTPVMAPQGKTETYFEAILN